MPHGSHGMISAHAVNWYLDEIEWQMVDIEPTRANRKLKSDIANMREAGSATAEHVGPVLARALRLDVLTGLMSLSSWKRYEDEDDIERLETVLGIAEELRESMPSVSRELTRHLEQTLDWLDSDPIWTWEAEVAARSDR